MKYAAGALGAVLLLALGAIVFPYTGLYDVSASGSESALEMWYLGTMSDRSIRARATGIQAPPGLTDSARVARGAAAFGQMCQTCHGAPGAEPSVTGQGMSPTPPDLSEASGEWPPEAVFWILGHGIKMAGMPAYGPTHSDEELWEIVAFVKALPQTTPEAYAALTAPPDPTPPDTSAQHLADDGHDHVH